VGLSGEVGAKQVHEVHAGGSATPGCLAATLGLSLAEAKAAPISTAPTESTVQWLLHRRMGAS
jgi:hypothetical protein